MKKLEFQEVFYKEIMVIFSNFLSLKLDIDLSDLQGQEYV